MRFFFSNSPEYSPYDIHSLIKSGVNIFNIDWTERDEQFFKETVSALLKTKRIPEMFLRVLHTYNSSSYNAY